MKKLIPLFVFCSLILSACSEPAEFVALLDNPRSSNPSMLTVVNELNEVLVKNNLPQIESARIESEDGKKKVYFYFKDKTLAIDDLLMIEQVLNTKVVAFNQIEIKYDGKFHRGVATPTSADSLDIPVGDYFAELDWSKAKVSNYYSSVVQSSAKLTGAFLPVDCVYEIPLIYSSPIPDSLGSFFVPLVDENTNLDKGRNKLIAAMNIANAKSRRNVIYFDHVLTLPDHVAKMFKKAPEESIYILKNRLVVLLENISVDMGYRDIPITGYTNMFAGSEADSNCKQIMRDMYPQVLGYQKEVSRSFLVSELQINPKWLEHHKQNR